MTINEKLALMDEIARKNNEAWTAHARQRRSEANKGNPVQRRFSPLAEWLIKIAVTFFSTLIMGIVALIC